MANLLKKEMKLSASPLSYFFILFALMAFLPGYPILVGAFFVSLGIFQSFQASREANDIVYSTLLPVKKSDIVKGKYIFCVFIELCAFVLSASATLIRMTVLSEVSAYRNNALMNANPAFLGFELFIFALFNLVFVCGFFKTAYSFAKPFIGFIILAFLTVGVAETLHHIPGLEGINAFGFEHPFLQLAVLLTGAVLYAVMTALSFKRAVKRFEKIDI